ncbi:hypothetical protein EXIGLDRAFT_578287, partial [Exidia glandulosa HHB12029]
GLYSAALTAFLIDSYKTLTQDPNDYVAQLLFQVVSLNESVNVSNRATGPIRAPGEGFVRPPRTRWVNGLWFTSLVLTLSVALLCILAKQWLYEYDRTIFERTVTTHHWVRRHVLHSEGLKTWRVPVLISILPTVLHLALFLFIAGLAVFLFDIDHSIS